MANGHKRPIELKKILAFHELVLGKSDSEKQRLADAHDIDFDEYKRRIIGKEKEAEFIVILRVLKAINHIEAYDEEISKITNEFTSDYKVELSDGYKMFIEVKHTDKDKYCISGGNLQNRIDYAEANGLPLRFAVSIKGYWGLFTSEYLQSKNGKLTLSDFFNNNKNIGVHSTWDHEFETCSYLFPKNLQIKSVYAKDNPKGLGIMFEPYGELVSYELSCNGRRIFRVKGKNSNNLILTILIEALQDRLANSEQEIVTENGFTIITEKLSEINRMPEYNFLLAIIQHIDINGNNIRNDNVTIASTEEEFKYPTLEYVRIALSMLVNKGLDIMVFKGRNGYRFTDYQKIFWTKNKI